MNTSHPSSPIDPAAPQTVARPTRTRRVLRGLLFCVCLAASLLALFFAVENWRGRKAWQEYRKEATARGVVLDYKDLIPPPIPDADNFAMTPFFTALFDFEPGTQKLRDPVKTRDGWSFLPEFLKEIPRDDQEKLRSVVSEQRQKRMNGDWQKARPRDFVAIYLLHQLDKDDQARSAADFKPEDLDAKQAASAFLDNYRIFEDLFEELRSAARRTGSRYPIRYEEENPAGILLPHLAVLKSLTQVLSYRASASLVAGKSDQALADVALAMRLSDSLTTERTLIAYLVRIAMINLVVQPAWEGLADRRWTDAQLVQLMEIFGRPKPFAEMKYALDGERGFGNALIELMRRRPELY
ncbi:MAG: hypothetical protein FJ405_14645, partial [Verrucomicrobia bacterium]|nr:hypothetical protein [Verrucomicrobiota bacterium]